MKKLICSIIFVGLIFYVKAQNLDSLLATPQTLSLSMSSPQPRMGEHFSIKLESGYILAHIFKSIISDVGMDEDNSAVDLDKFVLNVHALKKGKTVIGPLNFVINGTTYTTNTLEYEVIEALPKVDKGIWFRGVKASDSTFSLIIEQRVPAHEVKKVTSSNSFSIVKETEEHTTVAFKYTKPPSGLQYSNGNSYVNDQSIKDIEGKVKEFEFTFAVYNFKILDKSVKIKITKGDIENLPADYQFQDIMVQ